MCIRDRATTALLDAQQERAVEYARGIVEDLRSQGMDSRAEVARGDAVETVCEAARQPEVGLVAMASHGHSGFAALWSQSVGTGVQARVEKPLLLVNPQQQSLGK